MSSLLDYPVKLYTNFIIILDEINGIRYSQNELDNGNLTAIQLVNYLRISYLQKNFHTLYFISTVSVNTLDIVKQYIQNQ